ncbi:MAG: hypothetical protein K2W94_08920 [Alphaproteobacteria bacterium]|nr:hypothetical protein [Alphaproteobacteria bacterium]
MTDESLHPHRITFSHLVRAYQMDAPVGSFPINHSILNLASINELDFTVSDQPISASLNWFFDNYENSSGQRFRPAVSTTAASTSGAVSADDAMVVEEVEPMRPEPVSVVDVAQAELARDNAELDRLNEIQSRVLIARLRDQESTVDRGAVPTVHDILSDLEKLKKLDSSKQEARTKAAKLELQVKIFPEIFTNADAKEIALHPFLHTAMLAHREGRQALIEYRRNDKSWLQYSLNLILSGAEEKYKAPKNFF